MTEHDKDSKLKVIIDETYIQVPCCKHGPALVFERFDENGKHIEKFFACSACRVRDQCPLLHSDDFQKGLERYSRLVSYEQLQINDGNYCKKCHKVFIEESAHQSHPTMKIPAAPPTSFLPPLSNDKQEAQYFFSAPTLKFFSDLLTKLHITRVLCIGAPALHDHLISCGMKSFLLDMDERLYSLYPPEQFALFNMFNNYFFMPESKEAYLNFVKMGNMIVITDPPFGCRTEPLFVTLKQISHDYQTLWMEILPIIWIFPYFMETYIHQVMPELEMSDFKINYTNHAAYNETSRARKDLGSPIRLFTNINPALIRLPKVEYSVCKPCERWVTKTNKHCLACGICPSKNGATYRHCRNCRSCVKPNFKHCNVCKKCTLKQHDCKVFKKHVRCGICDEKGHVEVECKKFNLKKEGNCWICGLDGHVVQRCSKRITCN